MFLLLRPLFWEIDEFYSAIFKHHMPHLLDILSFIPLWLYVIHFAHKFFLSPKIFVYIFRGKKIYCFPLDLHRHSSLMIISSVCYDECQSNYGNFRSSYIFCSHKHSFFSTFFQNDLSEELSEFEIHGMWCNLNADKSNGIASNLYSILIQEYIGKCLSTFDIWMTEHITFQWNAAFRNNWSIESISIQREQL